MIRDLLLQQPDSVEAGPAALFLLFHGVGSNAEDLRGIGDDIAARHPDAWAVSVQSPDPSDLGQGWQWFSVRRVTEDNRAYRVAAAMPGFVQAAAGWRHHSGCDAPHTTLVGFSQGAIMAFESTQEAQAMAGRVVAMAGRFAAPPQRAHAASRIHLLHGDADGVVPARHSIEAHAQLASLHADVTVDLVPGQGRGIDARMLQRLNHHLAAIDRARRPSSGSEHTRCRHRTPPTTTPKETPCPLYASAGSKARMPRPRRPWLPT